MADAVLYDEPVTYPVTSAVANGKLDLSKQEKLTLRMKLTNTAVVGRRASTSDPWTIEIQETDKMELDFIFGLPSASINPDNLGWKSMADLILKVHNRPASRQDWPLVAIQRAGQPGFFGDNGFGVPDATKPTGYANPTLAQMQATLKLTVDESGDAYVTYLGNTGQAKLFARGRTAGVITAVIGSILNNTTDTSVVVTFNVFKDLMSGMEAQLTSEFTFSKAEGTESIEIGNYGIGRREIQVRTAVPGMAEGFHARLIAAGGAVSIPSIHVDALRKSAKAGTTAVVAVNSHTEGEAPSLTLENTWSAVNVTTDTDIIVAHVCAGDPDGTVEIAFDQSNSLNVLATAAFAGVGGLVGVGAATELERILANSTLSPLFQNVATALGATTAAVISGYVSALVAAYTQGWITNSQLFNLSNHAAWLASGYKTILAAAGAGIAIGEIPTLLGYLGVSNNVLSVAMNAVGGAATGAGVALGMASVMAKCVRHSYWGA